MKGVIDTSEVLGTVDLPEGTCELCAAADARYDAEARRLSVQLTSFLRTTDLRTKEKRFSAPWLPKEETITESVSLEESVDVAREIFQRWVRKVRAAAPALHSASF